LDTIINIALLLLGFVTAIVSIGGETWKKERKQITRRGWIAICSFTLTFVLGAWKEWRSVNERSQAKSAQEHLETQLKSDTERLTEIRLDVKVTREKLGEAVDALARIANHQIGSSGSSVAVQALDDLFNLTSSSVVKVKAVIGGELREKSGFFINKSGYVITADFAVSNPGSTAASQIAVETVDGRTYPAQVVKINPGLALAVLSTGIRNGSFLALGSRAPDLGEQVLVLGFTPEDFLTRTRGTIAKVDAVDGLYSRDRITLPGFGGGPLLDTGGTVLGVNWGALEPPVPGSARFIRSDRVGAFLHEAGLPNAGS